MLFGATFEGDSNKQELCTKKGKNSYFFLGDGQGNSAWPSVKLLV